MKRSLLVVFCALTVPLLAIFTTTARAAVTLGDSLALEDGTSLPLTWMIPAGANVSPRGLVILQHGMMRHATNMRSLAQKLAEKNILVLLPDVTDAQFLDPLFPELFANGLAKKSETPSGQSLPQKLLLAGFSAGARFLSHVAALVSSERHSLRGVLLLDPVVGELPEQQLGPRLDVPYFTILAKPSRCNADGNAFPLIQSGRFQSLGFRLKSASHCDFEGQSSDALCYLYCGFSPHQNSEIIRTFATEWISGLVDSREPHIDYLPGGKVFQHWQSKGLFDAVFK
ncbi:MAG: hypothetical protein RIR26_849 [Pseudomonadota bacterium]